MEKNIKFYGTNDKNTRYIEWCCVKIVSLLNIIAIGLISSCFPNAVASIKCQKFGFHRGM